MTKGLKDKFSDLKVKAKCEEQSNVHCHLDGLNLHEDSISIDIDDWYWYGITPFAMLLRMNVGHHFGSLNHKEFRILDFGA